MVIKIYILIFVFVGFHSFYSQYEEQRKYSIESLESFFDFIVNSEKVDTLLSHNHSKSIYYDLYLDTPGNLLFENKLSLRFRKRIYNDAEQPTYTFQLKNEMDSLGSIRMEIDEPELSFYKVKSNGLWVPIEEILDSIFCGLEKDSTYIHSESFSRNVISLEKWIQFKAEGAIAPFQKMRHLGFATEQISELMPVFYGRSERHRSHVYIINSSLVQNKIKRDKLPVFFIENKGFNWLLETSFDVAVFSPLTIMKGTNLAITEFEVESKYFQNEKGTAILNSYEKFLFENLKAVVKLDSKYRQAVLMLDSRK